MAYNVKVNLEVRRLQTFGAGTVMYRVKSLNGALTIPDWDRNNKQVDVHPGEVLSERGAKYLLERHNVYDVTVTPSKK